MQSMTRMIRAGLLILLCLGIAAPSHAQSRPAARARANRQLPPGARAMKDLAYIADGNPRHTLDLYLPEATDAARPLPLIVWIHGGAWMGGSKDNPAGLFMLPRGYALASINYRLSSSARWPAQIQDCKAAIRFLRANAREHGIDPDRIGVWGASAGGHLAAMLGTTGDVSDFDTAADTHAGISSRVQAVCDFFGPTDLLQINAQAPADSAINHDGPNSPEALLIGGPVQENKEKAALANPIHYITSERARSGPPFLIVHGDKDNLVPFGQSRLLDDALKQASGRSTYILVPGAGHGPGLAGNQQITDRVIAFFDEHLKGNAKPPAR